MSVVEKKANVKNRHRTAIAQFRKWKREHPKATRGERAKMFDFLIDSAALNEMTVKNK